ncbi:S8 family serine peptidase [Candidatus Peregrinibacteria bacterium]|nr:MAG: S8 family serine peptidase [Candidatus Peregrinibacteria bacterium]
MKIFSKKIISILTGSCALFLIFGSPTWGAKSVGDTTTSEKETEAFVNISPPTLGISSGRPQYVENEVLLFLKPDSQVVRNANFAVQTFGKLSMEDGEKVFAQSISQAFSANDPNDLEVETKILFNKENGIDSFSLSGEGDEIIMATVKSKSKSSEELLETYKNDPNILSADLNGIRYPTTNYENKDNLWHYFNNQNNAGVNADKVWATGVTGEGVVVAVIDTGIDLNHPEFQGQLVTGYDFSGNNDTDPSDTEGHGTHVAGTIAAKKDNNGVVGIAPDAKIMPLKVFGGDGGAYDNDIFEAISYATQNGANVINMSLGGDGVCSNNWQNQINTAVNAGVTIVVASGNSGQEGNPTETPASCNGIITVGATDFYKKIAPFSSYGNWVDIAAPGAGECVGNNTESCRENGIGSTWLSNQYARLIGTSMASPHIAGIAALMKSKDPSLTPAQILQIMCDNAEDIDAPGKDVKSGCGFANAEKILAAVSGGGGGATLAVSPTTQSIAVGASVTNIAVSNSASEHTFTLNAGTTGITKNQCSDGSTTCTLTAPTAIGTATLTVKKTGQTDAVATIIVTDNTIPPPPPRPPKTCSSGNSELKTIDFTGSALSQWKHEISYCDCDLSDVQISTARVAGSGQTPPSVTLKQNINFNSIAEGQCERKEAFSGTFATGGAYTTYLSYCKVGGKLQIKHDVPAASNTDPQLHGTAEMTCESSSSRECSELRNSDEVPQDYGAAYNIFSSIKPLLLQVTCNEDTATFETGNENKNTYVYKKGYMYSEEKSSWNEFTFNCNVEDDSGDWCVGEGKKTFQNGDLKEKNYVAAFTCQWRTNEWKCGCKDDTCNESFWQLQWFKK